MHPPTTPNLEANGDIRPYRAVAPSGSGDNETGEANANNQCYGVCAGSTRRHDSANHAEDGDTVSLQPGVVLMIECGGTITRGNSLKTDADGKAVEVATTGTTNQNHIGIALESGASGEIIRMFWQPQTVRPALS
jgi:hypothetical protein